MADEITQVVTAMLSAAEEGGVSDKLLAEILGVTRQAIYNYRDGASPRQKKLDFMRDLTRRIRAGIASGALPKQQMDVERQILEALDYPDYND